MSPNTWGGGGVRGGAQINFGDLNPIFNLCYFLSRWSHFYARWVWKFYLKREDYGDEEKRYLLR
jgi:hypothetical protein